jgi:DNA-directed RNA polymerase specialized sigma24 family protein
LTQQAFDGLLARLDADRDRSAREYELIRRRLLDFFDGRDCRFSEDCADETLNRVARIIEEGRDVSNLNSFYFLGVARNVLREHRRQAEKESSARGSLPLPQPGSTDEEEERRAMEHCMDQCLQRLPEVDREFIIAYYEREKHEKIEARKRLGDRLGLNALQLRKRAFNIRHRLKACAVNCVNRLRGGNESSDFVSCL